jgi:hypothetical protein
VNWQPIETYPLPEFDAKTWYRNGPRVLLWTGNYATIGSYGYTQKGKGRWQDQGRTTVPTHWMPLPSNPDTSSAPTSGTP